MSPGRVALVGAGPGDPSLLTLRAAELLRAADVVAHDELISDAILAMVPARAELLAVGRRAGQGETHYRLHPEVLSRALAGKLVVRLKAGDPMVFGRGGEEAEELAQAGIPFEIVPGVSAMLGAAASVGIPLTHRECSAQVVVSSGHRADGGLPPEGAKGRTLTLYMASHRLEENLKSLQEAGWPSGTPAALVAAATTPREVIVEGTLASLAQRARAQGVPEAHDPALVFVGDVVALRSGIDWRGRLPLRGRQIVVARARTGGSLVASRLRGLGATVVELPHIDREVNPAMGAAALSRALQECEVTLLASSEAAEAWLSACDEATRPVIAIGHEVSTLLRSVGVNPKLVLRGACGDALSEARSLLLGARVLVPVTDRGRASLQQELLALGANPLFVEVARELRQDPARWPRQVDLVVLPASTAAQALYAHAPPSWLRVPAVVMGARRASA